MKGYTCNVCGEFKARDPHIELRGVKRRSGILLPSTFCEEVFCSDACFWKWILENAPEPLIKP